MKITPAQFDIIHAAIERSRGNDDASKVDVSALADQLGIQYASAKRLLYFGAKQMGFTPTRAGMVSGQGTKPKTAARRRIDKMLATVGELMAEYESSAKQL